MLRIRQTPAILPALIILSALSSCASFSVTTWIIKQGVLIHGQQELSIAQGEGYRCYSKADDTAWREYLKSQEACCGGGSN